MHESSFWGPTVTKIHAWEPLSYSRRNQENLVSCCRYETCQWHNQLWPKRTTKLGKKIEQIKQTIKKNVVPLILFFYSLPSRHRPTWKEQNKENNSILNCDILSIFSHRICASRAGSNRLGKSPVLNLVSAPLTCRLKVICQESLVQSTRNKFLFPYNISSEEFQGQGTDRSQLLASSNTINPQVHIWSF